MAEQTQSTEVQLKAEFKKDLDNRTEIWKAQIPYSVKAYCKPHAKELRCHEGTSNGFGPTLWRHTCEDGCEVMTMGTSYPAIMYKEV